ncbi:MAG: lamin tail domain-containing protein [bacterium]|nr:lamin tail domain-containing protein [bacterium]
MLLFPFPATANVVISEVAWMGTPTQGVDPGQWWRYEWIELMNMGAEKISLQGWSIVLEQGESNFIISLSGAISPGEYTLVVSSDKISGAGVNYANLGAKLNNAGQRVTIRNAQGEVVEDLDAREGWFGGSNSEKSTMERRFPAKPASDPKNWGTSLLAGGTPGAHNSIHGEEWTPQEENGVTIPLLIHKKERQEGRSFLWVFHWGVGTAILSLVVIFLFRSLLGVGGSFGARRE